ncbi:hypothetical protein ACTFIW_007207 [Dictyostelium discoideum]
MKYNYYILFLILILSLFLSINVVESYGHRNNNNNKGSDSKILLKDVQVLTLRSGEMAKARRSSPIQQMECIGGTATKELELYPKTIQCYNMGSNGVDVQWKCEATLDSTVRLGTIDVSCEGYSYPEDPYITADSCGVFYQLEYTNEQRRKAALAEEEISWVQIIFCIAFMGLVLYAVFNWCGSPQGDDDSNTAQNNTATDNNYPGGFPGNNNNSNNSNNNNYGGNYQGYPNLNNNNNNNNNAGGCAQPNNGGGGGGGGWFQPGLWTGLASGYLFGRIHSNRNNHHYYNPSPSYNRPRSSYSSGSSGGSGISSSSSSYSGTSRR